MKRFFSATRLYKIPAGIFPMILLISYSCNRQNNNQPVTIKSGISRPEILKMRKPPVVTLLDTCAPPQIIKVPIKPGGTYTRKTDNDTKEINLLPPAVNPAGFYIPMKQYNVEDGLALSSVICSYCDKDGNLWFGTTTGGVSCFNGNSFKNYTMDNGLLDDHVFDELQIKEYPYISFRINANTWVEATVTYLVEPKKASATRSRIIKQAIATLLTSPEKVMFPKVIHVDVMQ